jgi:hypothetical protein
VGVDVEGVGERHIYNERGHIHTHVRERTDEMYVCSMFVCMHVCMHNTYVRMYV